MQSPNPAKKRKENKMPSSPEQAEEIRRQRQQAAMKAMGAEWETPEEINQQVRIADKIDAGEELTPDEEGWVAGPEDFPPTEAELAAQRAEEDFQGWAREMGHDPSLPETRQKYARQKELRSAEDMLEGSEIYPSQGSLHADRNMRAAGYDVKSMPEDQWYYDQPENAVGPKLSVPRKGQTRAGPGITLGSAMEANPGLDPAAALRKSAASKNSQPRPPGPRLADQPQPPIPTAADQPEEDEVPPGPAPRPGRPPYGGPR
jgi:hypothetical protein